MARPRSIIKWDIIDAVLSYNASKPDCAELAGISEDTLERAIKRKYKKTFTEYREVKKARIRYTLSKKQYEIAIAGNVTMLIWLGKQWLGQTDKNELDTNTTSKIKIEQADKGL